MTQWKPIKGFEGVYEVSEFGDVKRVALKPPQFRNTFVKAHQLPNGYVHIRLRFKGKVRQCYVHQLVAEHFLPAPLDAAHDEVNHTNEDGDKTNNHYSNLEWSTRKKNNVHKNRVLKSYHNKKSFRVTSPTGEEIIVFNLSEFAETAGLSRAGLNNVALGNRTHHHGYRCEYLEAA